MLLSLLALASLATGSPVSEGRQLFHDPGIGKNGVSCADCHATVKDETRRGDGLLRPGHSLFGVAKRKYWRGDRQRRFHRNVGASMNVCVQIFQRGPSLEGQQKHALVAFLKSISKGKKQPPLRIFTALEADLDYNREKYRRGHITTGRSLFYRTCHNCHPHAGAGLAPSIIGKTVAETARAIREGNGMIRGARKGSSWMPAFGLGRLSNEEVADIAAYVASLKP